MKVIDTVSTVSTVPTVPTVPIQQKGKWVDPATLAERLGVTVRTLQFWTRKYGLPVIKIGKTVRYDDERIDSILREKFSRGSL